MNVSVILPAAGLGTRMAPGGGEPPTGRKQFLSLQGSPILIHTIRRFDACPSVDEIVVALRPDDMEWFESAVAQERFAKRVRYVAGGDSRQESVANALDSLSGNVELVAVHDAVRPFTSVEMIEAVIATAAETDAAILGVVPVDTVKQVHLHEIRSTIPREHLVLAQTPQVFRVALLKEAFAKALAENFIGTDEASLVERLERVPVIVVPGSERNIKITKASDLGLADFYLSLERKESAGS